MFRYGDKVLIKQHSDVPPWAWGLVGVVQCIVGRGHFPYYRDTYSVLVNGCTLRIDSTELRSAPNVLDQMADHDL